MEKFLGKLSTDFLELLDDKEDYNVIINVGNSPNFKKFQAHSNVLRYRSMYFKNELLNASKDKNNIKTIELKHITIQQFDFIIKYIYGGIISLENLEISFILDLMIISYEFLMYDLAEYLETHLIENNKHWLLTKFAHVYKLAFKNNNIQKLQNWCINIASKYPEKIFDSDDFTSLQENSLVSLLKCDNLQMNEVKIWNYVIKWGMAQNPNLPTDPKIWSHENLLAMKSTLKNWLPLIRYFQISSDDIIDNIKPYYQILDYSLWDDITTKSMSPNRQISLIILPARKILEPTLPSRSSRFTYEIDSKIINMDHANQIASWIDNKSDTYIYDNNPYEFKLILRGSDNGFTNDDFWNLCDNRKNIVIIMRVGDEILGAYNPIGWNKSSDDILCKDCFTFSFKYSFIQHHFFNHIKRLNCHIYNDDIFGPCFTSIFYMRNNFDKARGCWWYRFKIEQYPWNFPWNFRRDQMPFCDLKSRNEDMHSGQESFSYFSVNEYEVFQLCKSI